MARIPITNTLGRALKGIEIKKQKKRFEATQILFSWYGKYMRDKENSIIEDEENEN